MAADAVRWSCTRCRVSVGRIDDKPTMLPASWLRAGGHVLCLTCSRAQAGEAAINSAPAASSREDRVRLRRTALIEFEIGRVPEAPNRTIALACRTSSATVAAVRDELERSAAPAPPDLDAHSVA
jgi:hypothetical protein